MEFNGSRTEFPMISEMTLNIYLVFCMFMPRGILSINDSKIIICTDSDKC